MNGFTCWRYSSGKFAPASCSILTTIFPYSVLTQFDHLTEFDSITYPLTGLFPEILRLRVHAVPATVCKGVSIVKWRVRTCRSSTIHSRGSRTVRFGTSTPETAAMGTGASETSDRRKVHRRCHNLAAGWYAGRSQGSYLRHDRLPLPASVCTFPLSSEVAWRSRGSITLQDSRRDVRWSVGSGAPYNPLSYQSHGHEVLRIFLAPRSIFTGWMGAQTVMITLLAPCDLPS